MIRENVFARHIPTKLAEAYLAGRSDDIAKLRAIAERRGLTRLLQAATSLDDALKRPPTLPWYDTAKDVIQAYKPRSTGKFSVYAILLKRPSPKGLFGLYIGQTFDDRRERFIEHKLGPDGLESIGRSPQKKTIVYEKGTHLLLNLTQGIEGMCCCEALWLEQRLIIKLRVALKGEVRCVEALDKDPQCTRHKPYRSINPTAPTFPACDP